MQLSIIILAIAGLINAGYLTALKALKSTQCLVGSSCLEVLSSPYSEIIGIPLSLFGMSYFIAVLYVAILNKKNDQAHIQTQFKLTAFGAALSVLFILLQLLVIQSFCFFCSLSALICFLLFGLTTFEKKQLNGSNTKTIPQSSLIIGITVSAIPLLILAALQLSKPFVTIHIEKSTFAKSGTRTFSVEEIDTLSGIKRIKNDIQTFNTRKQTLIEYLAKKSAKELGFNLDQFYICFVEHKLRYNNKNTREMITSLGSDEQKLTDFLKTTKPVPQNLKRAQFEQLKKDIMEVHEITIEQDTNTFVELNTNPHGSITIGNPKAPLHIVTFSDFLCSHCAKFHNYIEKKYEKHPDLLHLEFRHFPHKGIVSEAISRTSICAHQQGVYSEFAHIIFKNQKELLNNLNNINQETIETALPKEKINAFAYSQCIESDTLSKIISSDMDEVRRLNIQGTPTVFVNGYLGSIELIESEIKKASK